MIAAATNAKEAQARGRFSLLVLRDPISGEDVT